jgi:hypothetical protein
VKKGWKYPHPNSVIETSLIAVCRFKRWTSSIPRTLEALYWDGAHSLYYLILKIV